MPKPHNTDQDMNFDDLSHHFERNIYGGLKGRIRLEVLNRDLSEHLNTDKPLEVIDAGGGQGQFSLSLAENGHRVSLCDISQEMLTLAKKGADEKQVDTMRFLHCPIQELSTHIDQPADLLLCHALMEWMAQPETALNHLMPCLKKGGILSLAFFNIKSLIYKNLLRANYLKVESNNYVGMEGGLTPINPLAIEDVLQWCENHNLTVLSHSGIRVFYDYIGDKARRARHPESVVEMELKFSQEEPYRSLGRYIHIVAQKNERVTGDG